MRYCFCRMWHCFGGMRHCFGGMRHSGCRTVFAGCAIAFANWAQLNRGVSPVQLSAADLAVRLDRAVQDHAGDFWFVTLSGAQLSAYTRRTASSEPKAPI
eukprot:3084331-Pleurochrysis_carterae.AAC.1